MVALPLHPSRLGRSSWFKSHSEYHRSSSNHHAMQIRWNVLQCASGEHLLLRVVPDHGTHRTINISTWKIKSGYDGGLEAAGRGLAVVNVNITVLWKTKLTHWIYTQHTTKYSIVSTNTPSAFQVGVAIC